MRARAGLLLTAAVVSAPCARAQTSAYPDAGADLALFKAAFTAASPERAALSSPDDSFSPVGLRADPDAAAAEGGAFVLPAYAGASLAQSRLVGPGHVVDGGLAVWSSNEMTLGSSAAGVDSVRVSLSSVARPYSGVITAGPNNLADPEAEAFDLRYIHGWPSALKWSAAGYALDVSPHAGLGVSNGGGAAEAGAMVRFGSDLGRGVANKLGLHEVDRSTYAGKGRWYIFAAASGQAVGLNMTPGAPGMPHNSWSSESTSALISDAQAGVGWRKGDMQASFGYVHREIRSDATELTNVNGTPSKISDSMVAFSLSIHPH
jgi:hypothetical protein